MNKNDKEFLNEIGEKLSQISKNEKLPEVLNSENIASIVENQEQGQHSKMSAKRRKITALASSAAAVVLAVCAALAVKAGKNPAAVVPPPNTTQPQTNNYGDAPLYDVTDYATLEQKFAQYASEEQLKKNEAGIGGMAENSSSTNNGTTANPGGATGQGGGEAEHGQTNIQVEGVDEADILKNDGKYLYIVSDDFDGKDSIQVNSNIIKIIDVQNPDEMKTVSTVLPVEDGKTIRVRNLYINGNRMIVVCDVNVLSTLEDGTKYYGFQPAQTMTVVYDITDRAKPVEADRFTQDGDLISSRLVGNRVYILTNYYIDVYGDAATVKANCVPRTEQKGSYERIPVKNICCMKDTKSTSYLVVCSVNFVGEKLDAKTKAILGGGQEAYCTATSLYVANSVSDYSLLLSTSTTEEKALDFTGKTEIFSFLLNEGNAEFKAYGTVNGTVLNQFSMDEYKGYFRIATTAGSSKYSIVSVLNSSLKPVGEVKDIAPGETIKSVRFLGDTGYVVTFEQTDPLFVIDLSNPEKPAITGELKIPGFSSYLHPVSEGYVLGVGREGDENGLSANGESKISLFDVSDPKNPKEVSKLVLDGYSEAEYDHKAFLEIGEGVYAIPLSDTSTVDGKTITVDRVVTFSASYGRLRIVRKYVSDYSNLTVDNPYGEPTRCNNAIKRSTFVGDTLFTVGDYYVEAYSMKNGKKLSDIMVFDYNKQFADGAIKNGSAASAETTSAAVPAASN